MDTPEQGRNDPRHASAIPPDLNVDDWRNWNFDAVTDPAELAACCWWEYARESALIRNAVRIGRMYWTTSGQWPLPDAAEIGNYWGTIEGCVPNELCGFLSSTFTPGTTGGFPDPWQSLRVSERKGRLPVKSEREAILAGLRFHAFECLDRWPTTKPQAKEANRQSSEHSGYRPTASLSWTGAESFTGKIEWAIFSNVEIVAEFRKWVKETRPNEFPNRDKPGKPKDLRAHLRRLAALRLQSRYTVAEIIGGTSLPLKECKVILKAKQFRGETWNNAQQWSDARTEANQEFHRRFRFLPPDERPISWQKYRDTV